MSATAPDASVEALVRKAAETFDQQALTGAAPTVVSLTVGGSPSGDVSTSWRVDESGLAVEDGGDEDAELSLSLPWPDAIAVVNGVLSPAVAYMQGKLKASGNMELFMTMLKYSATPAFQEWCQRANQQAG